MNTAILVVWLSINGHAAMVQQPVTHGCERISNMLVLPKGSDAACLTPEAAAQAIYDGGCELVYHTDAGADQYICSKGAK